MKKKKQNQKKLSLEKLQIIKIVNPRSVKGGAIGMTTGSGLGDDTKTDPTSPE